MNTLLTSIQNFFDSHIVFVLSFLENLLFVFLIPTLCLIPAVIILGIIGKTKKDYSRLRKFTKWWLFSLFPAIIIYGIWIAVKIYFYKMVGL